jgi:hypothetical protein
MGNLGLMNLRLRDWTFLIGLALVVWGCWWHYPPLGPVAMGVCFMALAITAQILGRR